LNFNKVKIGGKMDKKSKLESQLRDQTLSSLIAQNKILKRETEKLKLDQRNVSKIKKIFFTVLFARRPTRSVG